MAASSNIRAGGAYIELSLNDKFTKELDKAEKKLKSFGKSITDVGKATAGIGTAITAPLLIAAQRFAKMGSEINDAAVRTGVGVEALQELKFAAEQTGAGLEDLEVGLKKMHKAIFDAETGSDSARKSLAAIGLTIDDLKGKTPEEQFQLIAKGLTSIVDPGAKSAIAVELLGKGGTKLIGTMEELTQNIKHYQSLGAVFSAKDVAAADKFGDSLDDLSTQLKAVVFNVGAAVAQALQPFVEGTRRALAQVIHWISVNRTLVVSLLSAGTALVSTGTSLIALGLAFKLLAAGIGAVSGTIGFLTTGWFLLLNPVVLVGAALVALGGYFFLASNAGKRAIDLLVGKFRRLSIEVSQVIGGIRDALSAGDIPLAAEVLFAQLEIMFSRGAGRLKTIMAGLQLAWEDVINGMTLSWLQGLGLMRKEFVRFKQDLEVPISALSKLLGKAATAAQIEKDARAAAKAGKPFSIDEAKKRLEDADRFGEQQNNRTEQNLRDEKNAIDQLLAAQLAAAQKIHEAKQKNIDEEQKKAIEDAQKRLDDATKKLTELRKRAAQEAKNTPEPGFSDPEKRRELDEVIEAHSGGSHPTIGIFNSAGAQALRGAPQFDRIAKATEESARWLRQMARNGSVRFA